MYKLLNTNIILNIITLKKQKNPLRLKISLQLMMSFIRKWF